MTLDELKFSTLPNISGLYGNHILHTGQKYFLGSIGFGEPVESRMIQGSYQKIEGRLYTDKDTGFVYYCKTTNNDTSVTGNFMLATNQAITNTLFKSFTRKIFQTPSKRTKEVSIPLSELQQYNFLYIIYDNNTTSRTPMPFMIEVPDLLDDVANDEYLFAMPTEVSGISARGFRYDKASQKLVLGKNSSDMFFGKVVGYKWYYREV